MKLSEIEDRILALEHALSNSQQCPADPCHVHYAAEEAVAEPEHDVTQESWRVGYVGDSGVIVNRVDPLEQMQVCQAPESWMRGRKHWPQRRVLIAHAPEMYRKLDAATSILYKLLDRWLSPNLNTKDELIELQNTIATTIQQIQKELKENE